MSNSREIISYSPYTLALFGVICAAIIGYLYFLNLSVVHVVMRTEVAQQVQDTRNQIALLETEYITAQHTIVANMAEVSDFREDQTKLFVVRDAAPNLVLGR